MERIFFVSLEGDLKITPAPTPFLDFAPPK